MKKVKLFRDNGDRKNMSSFKSKGLANPIGANHCWLNSTVQVLFKFSSQKELESEYLNLKKLLWHIDAFRQAVERTPGHYE